MEGNSLHPKIARISAIVGHILATKQRTSTKPLRVRFMLLFSSGNWSHSNQLKLRHLLSFAQILVVSDLLGVDSALSNSFKNTEPLTSMEVETVRFALPDGEQQETLMAGDTPLGALV